MSDLETQKAGLPPSSQETIEFVRDIETHAIQQEQVAIETEHVFHGGIYTRTICVPAGVMVTGALIKIPTTLTVSGYALIVLGDKEQIEVEGFMVVPASAHRKQVFIAYDTTFISMSFCTDVRTVEEAEREFTDEYELLFSNTGENRITYGEERTCQEV